MKIVLFPLLLLTTGLYAQFDSTVYRLAHTIEAATLHDHIYTLASPAFEGRETGTEGNHKAALYIESQFKADGINPLPGDTNYFQPVSFSSIKWANIALTISGVAVEHMRDYVCNPQLFPLTPETLNISSLLFLGYGIDDPAYSDYAGVDVKGKNIVIYNREPQTTDGKYKISGTTEPSAWTKDVVKKINLAREKGVASLWIIDNQFKDRVVSYKKAVVGGENLMGDPTELLKNQIPVVFISPTQDERLLGKKYKKVEKLKSKIDNTGKPYKVTIPASIQWSGQHDIKTTTGANVMAYIEGTDPVKKNEVVVVSAHYDHLGKRGKDIYFGADDNASGTSAVLEIAQAMAIAKSKGEGPKRSVLCILMTGEEKGLLGSQYYSEHPVFPLANTVADVNIDMIGRVDTQHQDPNYTYVIGSDRLSTALHAINENANHTYTHLQLDYTYNADDDPNRFYYRSDHYNFAKNGIPAIFYFSGVHEDYHRPTDTPDKIMFDKAATIAQLAFYTTWELANREERIKVDVVGRN
jgi:hypothetical protein